VNQDYYMVCGDLPPGHRHCIHGHLADCPSVAAGCPLLPSTPDTCVVQCGRMCWLFPHLREAQNLLRLLWSQGLDPKYQLGLSARQVASLVAKLPAGTTVEDCRLTQWMWRAPG
jgi:hypothetical protein